MVVNNHATNVTYYPQNVPEFTPAWYNGIMVTNERE